MKMLFLEKFCKALSKLHIVSYLKHIVSIIQPKTLYISEEIQCWNDVTTLKRFKLNTETEDSSNLL